MSNDLSFRERVERRDGIEAKSRGRSSSHTRLRIDLSGPFSAPVSLAELLRDNGLTLAKAHAAVTALAEKDTVSVDLPSSDVSDLVARLEAMGLAAHVEP